MSSPKFVERIGIMPQSMRDYALCSDGNVWTYGQRLDSNCGPLAEFLGNVKRGGIWRINLEDKYSEMVRRMAERE